METLQHSTINLVQGVPYIPGSVLTTLVSYQDSEKESVPIFSESPDSVIGRSNDLPVSTGNSASWQDMSQEQVVGIKFRTLTEQWREQRGFSSSQSEIEACPAYHALLAMGDSVIPLIMEELEKGAKDHWFRILELVSSEQPVRYEDRGHYAKMRTAWLDWWKTRS
ncbi:MAG: hypothetical protein OXN96_01550 [Bryobacterales bacterium]|nr:hypothetical protein [Bryobacterales bacterium]